MYELSLYFPLKNKNNSQPPRLPMAVGYIIFIFYPKEAICKKLIKSENLENIKLPDEFKDLYADKTLNWFIMETISSDAKIQKSV